MAIELFSGNCGDPMSPRVSFSYDFSHSNAIPVEQHLSRSNSSGFDNPPSFDFDFCVRDSSDHEPSSADELFSDGRLLPTEIKKKNFPLKQTDHQFLLPPQPPSLLHTEAVRENVSSSTKISNPERLKEEADAEKQGHNHKSFWRFKRSSSYGNGYGRSLCPLPLLSRSYSTGSTSRSPSSVKRNMSVSKEGKNNTQKLHASARSSSPSLGPNSHLKPPLKKCQASYGNGVPVILNVPSANLFGFGSIFSKSKDKTKRK